MLRQPNLDISESEYLSLLSEHGSVAQASKSKGMSRQALHWYAKRNGWIRKGAQVLEVRQLANVRKAVESGKQTLVEIAKESRVSVAKARQILKENQIARYPTRFSKPLLKGQVFGKLTVISKAETEFGDVRTRYNCQCSCGAIEIKDVRYLLETRTTRCRSCAAKKRYADRKASAENLV